MPENQDWARSVRRTRLNNHVGNSNAGIFGYYYSISVGLYDNYGDRVAVTSTPCQLNVYHTFFPYNELAKRRRSESN